MRGKKYTVTGAIGAAVLVLGLGLSACGTNTAGQSTGHRPPAATQPAPARHASSLQDQVVVWWLSTGKSQSKAVSHDLNAVAKDAAKMDASALSADGNRLRTDAVKAGNNPPPGALASSWCKAMAHYRAAGQALCDGQLYTATNQMTGATPHLNNFMHALKGALK